MDLTVKNKKEVASRSSDELCPVCDALAKARDDKSYPFCSPRCQAVDLGRWLNEDYRIPDDTSQ